MTKKKVIASVLVQAKKYKLTEDQVRTLLKMGDGEATIVVEVLSNPNFTFDEAVAELDNLP